MRPHAALRCVALLAVAEAPIEPHVVYMVVVASLPWQLRRCDALLHLSACAHAHARMPACMSAVWPRVTLRSAHCFAHRTRIAGEGKPKMLDERETTVYKRALDMEYQLKMKASRAVFSEINKRFPTMPFALRSIAEGDEKVDLSEGQLRLGLVECLNHGLLHPYPVLHEKQGELVAQVRGCQPVMCRAALPQVADALQLPLSRCTAVAVGDGTAAAVLPVLPCTARLVLLSAAARSRARCC